MQLKLMSAVVADVFAHDFICRKHAPERKRSSLTGSTDYFCVCASILNEILLPRHCKTFFAMIHYNKSDAISQLDLR